jgi:hypothetical protein
MKSNKFLFFGILLVFVISIANISASSFTANLFSTSGISQNFSSAMCQEGQDLAIQIVPFGCTPSIVRTDLLEENNVPVYCQLGATQINPLINIEAIDSVSVSGQYSKEVSGVAFHPAKAALGVDVNLDSPVLNNIGYVVINLKKQPNSSATPDYISGNLTAKIKYKINNAFGIGNALFYLQETTDSDWEIQKYKSGFWNGKGYLRVESIEKDNADISVYSSTGKISTVNLKKGETSNSIYLPGFECKAGLKLKLESLENSDTRALLKINADAIEVAEGEKFLDNKCTVNKLKNDGINKQVTIKCTEDSGAQTFTLKITPKVTLNIEGAEKGNDYGVGDYLYSDGDKRIYLVYAGTKKDSTKENDLIAYLAAVPDITSDRLTDEQISSFSSLVNDINNKQSTNFLETINEVLIKAGVGIAQSARLVVSGQEIKGIQRGEIEKTVYGKKITFIGYAQALDTSLSGDEKEYYESAKADYETIIKQYSAEEYGTTTFGQNALQKEISLASSAGQKETAFKLCDEFKQTYLSSTTTLPLECESYQISNIDVGEKYVTINKNVKQISFIGIFEPTIDDYGVKITINSEAKELTKNKEVYLDSTSFVKLISADDSSAKVTYSLPYSAKDKTGQTSGQITLEKEVPKQIEGYTLTLTQINLKKIAKVSVIPNLEAAGTNANFSFKIGIEQRAFQMSPDKIKETIKDLNKTINDWTKISEGLGATVKVLKTACLTTGATLIAKNFLTGLGGAGTARQYVMRGTNGWFEKCEGYVKAGTTSTSGGTYSSVNDCLNKNSNEIDSEVASLTETITNQNNEIKKLENANLKPQEFLSSKTVDTEKFVTAYLPQVRNSLLETVESKFTELNPTLREEIQKQLSNIYSYDNWKKNVYSIEQLKEIELDLSIINNAGTSDNLKAIAVARLSPLLADIAKNGENILKIQGVAESAGIQANQVGWLTIGKDVKKIDYLGLTLGQTGKNIVSSSSSFSGTEITAQLSSSTPVYLAPASDGNTYLFVLKDVGNSKLSIDKLNNKFMIYDYDTMTLIENPPAELTNIYFEKSDATTYKNEYKNPKLSYYETAPYKGMPAVVPFDLKNGWYAATKQTLAIGSNIQTTDASGRVNSYWLCNVGADGNENFQSSTKDDKCQMINLGTGQPYDVFNGLSSTDAKKFVDCGVDAITQAASAYPATGKVSIKTDCGGSVAVSVGSPAVDVPQFECQDFMSPKECLLLFNVCDPVICPSSRCDLDGAYPVKDVIQTGIIGSLVLCFPNYKEGIIMPVCLTGVQAGVDGLLSVLSGTRDCLQESLNTGKTVGICDEIFSVYMCNFLWEQALPLSNVIVPKLIEVILGQNVKGGGEYLGVATAWTNAEKSINYFTNYYGTNSKQAFLARTTEGISSGVCKMFISGVVPSGADFVSTLTEPDSPVQFTGRFDEIALSSATVPPTSHYKVFYHIYAGKDSGVYYQIYLKGSSESSYYQDTATNLNIASGYIAVGSYASETIDKIATSGYKQLCISINGQAECGFEEVSTSFALNYVKDAYLEEQASETDITTENGCISGAISAYSVLNLNVQSSAEKIIDPSVYSSGIIRICATADPGQGTDASAGTEDARWKDVGYCGDEQIRCWIDTDSVKEVIKTLTVENDTLTEITTDYLTKLRTEGGYLTEDDYSKNITKINNLGNNEKDSSNKVSIINGIIEKVFTNKEKATLLGLRGDAYFDLFKIAFISSNEKLTTSPTALTTSSIEQTTILGEAEKLANANWEENRKDANCGDDTSECYDNVCARFVLRVLAKAGVINTAITNLFTDGVLKKSDYEDVANLVTLLKTSSGFKEITDFTSLKEGDIVIFSLSNGIWTTDSTKHTAVFKDYTSDKKKVNVYGAPGIVDGKRTKVELQTIPIKLPILTSGYYIYKVYRYTGN